MDRGRHYRRRSRCRRSASFLYCGVTRFSLDVAPMDANARVWPENRRLGDFQLDEILPVPGGCSHEVKLTGGTVYRRNRRCASGMAGTVCWNWSSGGHFGNPVCADVRSGAPWVALVTVTVAVKPGTRLEGSYNPCELGRCGAAIVGRVTGVDGFSLGLRHVFGLGPSEVSSYFSDAQPTRVTHALPIWITSLASCR
jgi:hypothetical protein